jgi:hypothetical protein
LHYHVQWFKIKDKLWRRSFLYNHARFFHVGELNAMTRDNLHGIRGRRENVIFLLEG